ncbi:SHOCT domain-containing protein [Kitasatospora sp. NPDC097643]|uniref:SHOCT domain-containing protein n=1 Tax=Kitasatospora sp. NPDC097643 TaxID=3157230 RepID=UPI00332B3FD3
MTVSMLLFWALVIFGGVALFRYLSRTTQHGRAAPTSTAPTSTAASPDRPVPDWTTPARPAPEQLLAERLARGEIDPDEYRSRLEALRSGAAPPPASG